MRHRRNGAASRSSRLPTEMPRPPKGTSTSLGWLCPLNCPSLWAWRVVICQRLCSSVADFPSVHGVVKKDRMRGQWLITYGLCTTTWASYVPTALTFSPQAQTPCSDMLWYASQWQVVATGGHLLHTMREMMMAMMTSNSSLMRTRLPHHLHITSHHHQPNPPLWCPCQGRPFLLRPSSSSNYPSFWQC